MLYFYRVCAHTFCVILVVTICYFLMKGKDGSISLTALMIIILFAYCTVTYFIDAHADAAEGLQVAYLTDRKLAGGKPPMTGLVELKQEINTLEGVRELPTMEYPY